MLFRSADKILTFRNRVDSVARAESIAVACGVEHPLVGDVVAVESALIFKAGLDSLIGEFVILCGRVDHIVVADLAAVSAPAGIDSDAG